MVLNKTMRRSALVLSICVSAFALVACQPKAEKKEHHVDQHSASEVQEVKPSLQGEAEKVQLKLPECDGNSCPEFMVERLNTNQSFVDEIIDQAILKNLEHILAIAQQNPSAKSETVKEATKENKKQEASAVIEANATQTPTQQLAMKIEPHVQQFLDLHKELQSLGATGRMSVMLSPKILNAADPLATVVLNTSSYLGGAHGSSAQQYFNFDLKQKKLVELDAILQPNQKENLQKLAHEAFKTWVIDSKLADRVSDYEQAWKFVLTDNYYLSQQGLILQYGEYEIGPYVVGLPRLVIPYDQLKTVLKKEYLPAEYLNQPASQAVHTEQVKK